MNGEPRPGHRIEKYVRFSCYLALVALAMIAWSLVHPKPLPVIGAMSVGQVLGTLSLGLFGAAVLVDVRYTFSRARKMAMPAHQHPHHPMQPAEEPTIEGPPSTDDPGQAA